MRWASLAGLLSASTARADFPTRLDHAGALGLSVALGSEYTGVTPIFIHNVAVPPDAFRGTLDMAASYGFSNGNEVLLGLRLLRGPDWTSGGASDWGGAIFGAYRLYRGRDEWKSYVDLGGKADTSPRPGIGVMAKAGLLYELSPVMCLFVQAGGAAEMGSFLRLDLEATAGIGGRTYLLP